MKRFLTYVFASLAFLVFAVSLSRAQATTPSSGTMPVGITATLGAPNTAQAGTPNCPAGYKPCVHLTWTSAQIAATVTTNRAGKEISGPGVANVYECTGPSTVCTTASLSTIGQPGSPWQLLPAAPGTTCMVGSAPCSVAQTTSSGAYQDVSGVAYGQTRNYVVTNTWTGSQGGVASGYSNIFALSLRQP